MRSTALTGHDILVNNIMVEFLTFVLWKYQRVAPYYQANWSASNRELPVNLHSIYAAWVNSGCGYNHLSFHTKQGLAFRTVKKHVDTPHNIIAS